MSNEQVNNLVDLEQERLKQIRKQVEERSRIVSSGTEEDPKITQMNEKHIYVQNMGGNDYITDMIYSEVTNREELTFIKEKPFRNRYMNESFTITVRLDNGNTKQQPVTLGDYWLGHAERKTVAGVIFDPTTSEQIVDKFGKPYLNLWEGFACKAKQGSWRRTLKHIYRILCSGDSEKFKYVVRWLAWTIQNPAERAEVAIVFKGLKGAGKGFICTQLAKIFGKHGMSIGNREHLIGKFNGHMDRLCFLFCDEAYYPGDVKAEGVVKVLITEPSVTVERKRQDARSVANRLHIMMSTNNEWVIPASEDERRYFIESVSDQYAKGKASDADRKKYFDGLWGEMEQGGRAAMLFDLGSMKLGDWHPRNYIPMTAELKRQIALSQRKTNKEIDEALFSMIEEARLPYDTKWFQERNQYGVIGDKLWRFLFGDNTDARLLRSYATKGGPILKALGVKKDKYTINRTANFNRTLWIFPELDVLRKKWDDRYGAVEWCGDEKMEDDCNKWQQVRIEDRDI